MTVDTSLKRAGAVPLAACLLLLAACAAGPSTDRGLLPAPLLSSQPAAEDAALPPVGGGSATPRSGITLGATPRVPEPSRTTTVRPGTAPPASEGADLSLAFDQLPLPTFIQVVFGNILKKSFSVDPAVMARTDLITLRTGQPQTPSQVLDTARLLLKSYGVAVNDMGGGVYRIVPDTNQAAYQPEIRRGRAQPDVPLPLRPVFNLVEMTSVRHTDVANWLRAMFGARLNVLDDPTRNALLISGQAADVTAALEAVQVLDQPLMRGRSSQLLTPSSLGVDELARRLVEILTAEGFAAGVGPAAGLPISLVPVPASNSLLVFTSDAAVLQHVVDWSAKLDSLENDNRRSGTFFSYEVKYADAQALAKTMQDLMSAQQGAVADAAPAPAPGVRVIGAPPARAGAGRFVVNAATNTLLFTTTNPDDYAQLLGIMRSLDKPAKSALIEVTVAEVRLGDSSQLGIDWNFGPDAAGRGSIVGGTSGGVGLGTGGLSLSYLNSVNIVRARLNALAADNRARILSTPRVMARNGEAATIQVGQEVPIVTSQQSTGTTTGTGSNTPLLLQQIQYRSTGVILRVKPIIFAGRVELEVQQEVSSASSTSTGVSASPTFSTRKVDTKLSIRDGATVALGGLISRTENRGQTGVPLLKDIPAVGQLFRTDTSSGDVTELIILITPYVVENDLVAEQVTQAMRKELGSWAQPSGGPILQVTPSQSVVTPATAQPRPATPVVPQVISPAGPASGATASPQSSSSALPAPGVPLVTGEPGSHRQPPSLPSAVVAPSTAPMAAPAAPLGTPITPPPGRPVTNPDLLRELRESSEAPTGSPRRPTAQPSRAASAPAAPASTTRRR